jgi:hypothetical protein
MCHKIQLPNVTESKHKPQQNKIQTAQDEKKQEEEEEEASLLNFEGI